MAGPKNAFEEDYGWLTLLSINTALRESYHALSISVRVPYRFLTAGDIRLLGFFEYIALLLAERDRLIYNGHGVAVLPGNAIGKVFLCDELFGEYFGLPTHRFAASAERRGLLARYVASLLLAGSLGFSGFSGSGRKKRKLALGLMHAAGREHCRHFAHSGFLKDIKKTIAEKCDRVRSDFRELGITDTDLSYAIEKKPGGPEKRALALKSEMAETETLLWMIERKKKGPMSEKKQLQLAIQAAFLKKAHSALEKLYKRRAHWDAEKKFGIDKKIPFWKNLERLSSGGSIPAKNLISVLGALQPLKKKILLSII